MASYLMHLMGQREPINLDLPFSNLDALMDEASRAKILVGHIATPDEDGVYPRVMIATTRIECVVELT